MDLVRAHKREFIALGLFLFLFWGFFPRTTRDWDILDDEEKQRGKRDYLKGLTGGGPTPNILVILADDLGRNDLLLYDRVNGVVETPNIEALAARGVLFSDATSTAAVSAPSRAGMLTGRIQNRAGFDSQPMQLYINSPLPSALVNLFINTDEMKRLPLGTYPKKDQLLKQGALPSEIYLQEALQARDYQTALMGKWHLGYGKEQSPNARGFDEFYGFLEAYTYYADPKDDNIVSFEHEKFWEKHILRTGNRKGPAAIQRNGKEVLEKRHLTDAITQEALDYLRKRNTKAGEEPFFLYLSYLAPHTPFQELKKYYDQLPQIEDPNRRLYGAMIKHLDDAIGELLAGLEELGLEENTLIFFGSDNGGAAYTGATDNGDLAAGKFTYFEGGIQIPLIMSWPGRIPRGLVYDQPVSLLDVFATSLGASGTPLPEDRVIDGVNLLPYVTGQITTPPREELFWKSDFNLTLRQGEWKLHYDVKQKRAHLYNLYLDKGETTDRAAQEPEVLERMIRRVLEYNKEMRPALWPRVMNYEIEVNGEIFVFAI